jgi:hypothetical protein
MPAGQAADDVTTSPVNHRDGAGRPGRKRVGALETASDNAWRASGNPPLESKPGYLVMR